MMNSETASLLTVQKSGTRMIQMITTSQYSCVVKGLPTSITSSHLSKLQQLQKVSPYSNFLLDMYITILY